MKEEQNRDAVKYEDIFGDMEMQLRISPVLMRLLEIREEMLESQGLPVHFAELGLLTRY